MANSNFSTTQYTSEEYVESCGAIVFNFPESTVCLVKDIDRNEWVLPKGRRNCRESRQKAALREVREETGYQCHLHPTTMSTRAPPKDATGDVADQSRSFDNLTEPFMVTTRELGKSDVKFIWWYIAGLDKTEKSDGEAKFEARFFSWKEALDTLHFEDDKTILRKAIELVKSTK
jgi:8-oxo-dGTP pyrophosphatase MutT (NUDIX family)